MAYNKEDENSIVKDLLTVVTISVVAFALMFLISVGKEFKGK